MWGTGDLTVLLRERARKRHLRLQPCAELIQAVPSPQRVTLSPHRWRRRVWTEGHTSQRVLTCGFATRPYVSVGFKRSPGRPRYLSVAEKKGQFPRGKPLSVHFSSWRPRPPAYRLAKR